MSGRKNNDRILRFSLGPEIGRLSPHSRAIFILNYTENLEKREDPLEQFQKEIQWRRRPEFADLGYDKSAQSFLA